MHLKKHRISASLTHIVVFSDGIIDHSENATYSLPDSSPEDLSVDSVMDSPNKVYRCRLCSFHTSTYTQLQLHMPKHGGKSLYQVELWLGFLVCCGLTSHSAIFQLYSDRTVCPNLDLLPGIIAMGI